VTGLRPARSARLPILLAAVLLLPAGAASAQEASPAPDPLASPPPVVCPGTDGPVASPAPSPDPFASPLPSVDPLASPLPAASAVPLPSAVPSPDPLASPAVSPDPLASPTPDASPTPTADPCLPEPATGLIPLGRDGRFTMLLLGSDYRKGIGGERTDVMLVMSIDPESKRVVGASIPRDMIAFPRAKENGGGTTGQLRINAMYEVYRRGDKPQAKVDRKAVGKLTKDFEAALKIEIDAWAFIRFKGFSGMMRQLKFVHVPVEETIDDYSYRGKGAVFPANDRYKLTGKRGCNAPKPCRDALVYVRSRKGSVGNGYNSDFERSRRQQLLVMGAAERVVEGDFSPAKIAELLVAARAKVVTDLPLTVEAALELLELVRGATMAPRDSAVFGPSQWAYTEKGDAIYTFRLRVPEARAWFDERFSRGGKGKGG